MSKATTYNIKIPQFEGPFDLLLFFIERDELDIHDIPIAPITDDFLAYIRAMEALNIDLASEFILVAATLMRIKAKMLIPRKPVDEEGNEIDPRDELVQRLIEYKRYKEVQEDLRSLEKDRTLRTYRGNTTIELRKIASKALVDAELESLTLFKLMKAFQRVMARLEGAKSKPIHKVYTYSHTIQGQQIYILSKLEVGKKTSFQGLFGVCKDRMHAIITFLAFLELLNLAKCRCITGQGMNNFWLTAIDPNEVEPEDVVHDDDVIKEEE